MDTRINKFQERTHFKMYKSGKQWLVAGMATFALVGAAQVVTGHAPIDFGQNITAHAADSSTTYWMGQNAEYYKRYNELPQNSSVPESTQSKWGSASGEIVNMRNNTKFVFDGLTYDKSTGKYILKAELQVPTLTTGGAGRTSYFDMGFSDSLSAKTSNPHLSAANGNQSDLTAINGVYHNDFNAGGTVGGTSTITVAIDPVKVLPTDQITAMYSSDTGTTGYHAIFSVVRTLGYNDFGKAFNDTLLAQMKQNSTDAINTSKLSDKQKKAEQANVNAVTTDDDFVNKLQAIDKDVQAKSAANAVPIDQQRATALQQYKDAHNVDKILNEISNDQTLTQTQKDEQSKQVNDAVAVIKGKLDQATDSDDVATAIADTSQDNAIATAYKPGTDLATQIKNAQDAIDAQVAKSKALVDNNNTLTDAQKSAQKSAIDTVATAAKNDIGAKTSADDINTAQTAGIKNLTDLDTAKPAAYATLTNKANNAISTINNDQNLTDAQKQDRINQVNTALKGITDKIDQATDATTVNNLASSTDLDKAISTATSDDGVTPVTTQRANANNQIDQVAAATKKKIDEDSNLTTKEKADQTANVDKAVSDAKAAIADGSAQVIADTVSKAQGTIAGSYVAGKPLKDRQKDAETALNNAAAAAKSNLDAQVAQANNDINNNNYLTDAQKAAQKQAIQDAANAAITKINDATDADAVNDALTNGQNVVNNLNAQKLAAHTSVNNEAKTAEDAINANPALTATDKANRIAQIETAKTNAGNAIDSATDASVIANVPASGQTFDNAVKAASDLTGVKSISDQQAAAKEQLDSAGTTAKSAIDQAATAQENAIDQNGNLTPEQKTAQKAAVDNAVAAAKAAIDKAGTADAINQAKQTGLDTVNGLNDEKTAARKTLAQDAQAAIDSINNNNALTSDEKKSRVQAVQDAYNAATTTVDNATDANTISAVPASGSTFDKAVKAATDFSNVKSVAQQQADAKAALDSAGTTAKSAIDQAATAQESAIDQNGNLTPEQKTAQKAALDQSVANAKAAIDAAQTADAINQAKQSGLDNVNGLNNEKTAARKALAKQAQAAIDTINGNNALTAADKASRIKQVQDAYNTATGKVDAATNAADVTAAQNSSDFTNAIKSATDFSNVTSLDGQKDAAKAALDNAGQAAKDALDAAKAAQENAIDQDGNLTPEQKAAQKAAIDQAVTNAKTNISDATNADDVTKAKDAAVTAISNLSGEKTAARQALAKQAQDAINTINGNNALTDADKASRIKQVQDAYNTATSAVDAATTADGVTAAQNSTDFSGAITKATDFSNVKSLDNQKSDADKAIDDAAIAIKAKIDADPNLSDADKTAQKSTVDSVATAKKGVIDSATKADDVATAKDAGIQAVNDLDKTDGNASLTKQANDAKSAINSNAALTQAAKDAFNKQIDAAKGTAQNTVNNATDKTAAQQATSSDSDYAKSLANILNQASQTPSVQTQQATAEKAIDDANTAAKAKVDADKNLSDADKAAQKTALDTVANQAKSAIQQATTADAINQAQANGTNALSNMDKTADDESAAKQAADAHTAVNNNSALTQAQKDAFNKQIDDAKNAAQDIVNKATDPTTASAAVDPQNSDYAKQLATIAKQASAVPSLDSQKETADQAIDNAANTVKSGIDADKNLSDADKAAQKAVVDSQVTAAKQAIANANNADDVNTAQAQGVKAINDLANAKTSADETIASAVKAAHDAINNNPALSTAEKASRNAAIDTAASKVQGVVNQATTPDAVNAAIADPSDFKTALSGATDTSGVKTIAQQQADAEKAIDDANTAAKAKVDADPSISDADKAAQKATLDGLANTAKQNIQNAQTADDITNAQNAGVKSLNDLDKTTADKQLSDKVAQAHATVNGNNDLSQAEKDARNQAIDAAAKTAQDAINKATNLDDVTKALANGADFDNAVSKATSTTGVTPLADQKTAAAKAIDDAVTAAKSKIDADPSISDADKQAQKTVIDDLANQAKANINAATNADGVTAAKTAGVNSIANLDKTPVDADLAKQIQAAHAAVNGNPALSAAEKQARNQAIDTAAKAAQDAVNAATTIDDANAVIASGSALDNALKSATSNDGVKTVAEQQAAAVQAINDALAKVEARIDADKTLTDADKQAQKAVAAKQAEEAIANINKANNADDIATAQKAGIDALNKLEDAKTATDASLADQVKAAEDAINGNKALSSDQKADRLNALHQAQAAAQDAINKATDPDAVAEVIANGSDFAKAVATATSNDGVKTIADQQADADKAIDDAATKAKQAIDADKTLTDADKQSQKDVIDGQADMFKKAINAADNADDINKDTATGVKFLQDLTDAKTQADAKLASDVQKAHDAVNNNKALSQAQKDARNKQIDDAQAAAQDVINKATTLDGVNGALASGSDYDKAMKAAQDVSNVPSVADQQKAAIAVIQQAADKAKQAIDADKTLTDAQKADQKAAIDAIVKSATDAITQATDADSINKIQADTTDALNNIHGQKADALSKLQKQADDANHAIDANNALTADQKQAAHEAVAKALTNAQALTDQATTADDVAKSGNQAVYNKALQDIADGLAKVPSLADQAKAAIEKLTEAVKKAKDALTGPDADAQKKALDKVLSDGTAKLNAQTNADDLNKTLADVLNTVNGLNQAKADALTDLDAKAKKATDTINADPAFTDDEKATRVAAVAKALQDAHDAVNEATDLPGVEAARNAAAFPEALNNATSDTGVQTLADRKADAKKALQDAADKAKSAIDADKTLTDAQKTAQKQAIDQALKTAQDQIDAATTATKVDVSKATNLPTFDTLNKAKSDAHQAEDKAYNDAKAAIQNNNDLTDAEKQARISDLDKAHQAASDAIDKAVTPDEIKTATETAAFDNAVKTATDFSKVTPLPERKQAGAATINDTLKKAVDEVNANTKLDADAKDRQIAILKKEAQDAVTKLNNQTNAQSVVDFVPTVVPTFENLNQSKVDARARLQDNAAKTKAAIDADDNLSNDQKQSQKDAVDAALKQAVIDVDNGQDVPTVKNIPDGSTAVKEINQGHVTATKTPTQQEEDLNAQIDDQATKVKAAIDADVTLKAAEKAAQKHTVDSFVAETKAKIAGLTKYQDRLDVTNQALDSLKNLHQQGKPLADQKADAIAAIDQKAAQIRTQIANDTRLTQAQKEVDYQLVADAVAKAKAQVNAALNADEIAAGLEYGTVQLESAYQQKVQEQYAEKQPTTPTTIKTAPVLPQTGETEKNHEGAFVAEALVASVAGFFLAKTNKRRKNDK